MKTFLIAMVIAAVLIGGGAAFNFGIEGISEQMSVSCGRITECVEARDFASAQEHTQELAEYIEEKKIILASVIEHKTIDDIELCLSELAGYTESEMFSDSLVRCRKLEHLIRHLPANYSVTPQNIL
ncbi:MAG: DUF4363 family protein [Clostridia bacterium]|nr:DUF4363 family protein [Clostridia bacterium]